MAQGDDPTLDVQINIQANTQGAQQATEALRQVTEETRRSGRAASDAGNLHGSAFGKIVTGSRAASGAMRGLNEAMRGGIFTVGGLARALNDLFIIIRAAGATAGPIALLALGIGVLIGALRGLAAHLKETHGHFKELSSETLAIPARLKEVDKEAKKTLSEMEGSLLRTVNLWKDLNEAITDSINRTKALRDENKKLADTTLTTKEDEALASNRNARANLNVAEAEQLATAKPGQEAGVKAYYDRLRAALPAEATIREGFKQLRGETDAEFKEADRRDTINAAKARIAAANQGIAGAQLERALADNRVGEARGPASAAKSAALGSLRQLGELAAGTPREGFSMGAFTEEFVARLPFTAASKNPAAEVARLDSGVFKQFSDAAEKLKALADAENNRRKIQEKSEAEIRGAEKEKGAALTDIERASITKRIEAQEKTQRDLEASQAIKKLQLEEREKLSVSGERFSQQHAALEGTAEELRARIFKSGFNTPERESLNELLASTVKKADEIAAAQRQASDDIVAAANVQINALKKISKTVRTQAAQADAMRSYTGQQ